MVGVTTSPWLWQSSLAKKIELVVGMNVKGWGTLSRRMLQIPRSDNPYNWPKRTEDVLFYYEKHGPPRGLVWGSKP